MKALKLLFGIIITSAVLTSCQVVIDDYDDNYYQPQISLEEVVTNYDLWYVDYNRTTGSGEVPFMARAFTLTFLNGNLYANNNIVDIGYTGNGYGINVGYYDTRRGSLEIDHTLDGYVDFDVVVLSNDELKFIDNYNNVTYYLIGYDSDHFDYDKLFYDNIEYFLQEYEAWEKVFTSQTGAVNDFDYENYLQFTPENLTTFYSSQDEVGTNIDLINWDFVGDYKVYDVQGYDDLKILTLDYDFWDNEEFELSVINDGKISLYHVTSETTYEFAGRSFIQYLKQSSTKDAKSVSKTDRKRTKVIREVKVRKH